MEKFNYKSISQIEQKAEELKIKLPFSDKVAALKTQVKVNGLIIPNRLIVQPMEGCDGTSTGSPDVLTIRRYKRFAQGGAGLLWFEAVAVVKEGRANPRQLFLDENNLDDFKKIVEQTKNECFKANGYEPIIIMQATHSGRYSKPNGLPEPIVGRNNPYFEKDKLLDSSRIATDDYLKSLEEKYGKSANLAKQAGFDGVDIKACHGYLLNELLASFTRDGEYGGSFENRTKLLLNAIKSANVYADDKFVVASRLSCHDGYPNPYGWGCDNTDTPNVDLTEPLKLIDIMHNQLSVKLIDITMGNPYQNPHVNRPYDMGGYISNEHQFVGISRMLEGTKTINQAFKGLVIVSSANTYLREFGANLAAGEIEQDYCSLVGFGRQAFAYPEFAKDLLNNGCFDPKKCCKVCSKCTELMRAGTVSGCVLFDSVTYLPIYKEKVLSKKGL